MNENSIDHIGLESLMFVRGLREGRQGNEISRRSANEHSSDFVLAPHWSYGNQRSGLPPMSGRKSAQAMNDAFSQKYPHATLIAYVLFFALLYWLAH